MRAPDVLPAVYFCPCLTAVEQGFYDVLLNHVARDSEPRRDLAIGQAVNAAEHKNLLATLRQSLYFARHGYQMLAPVDDLFLIRPVAGHTELVFQRNQQRTFAGLFDDGQSRNRFRDLKEIGLRIFYRCCLRDLQNAQSRFLHGIGGIFTIPKAVAEKPHKTIALVRFQKV